MELKNIAESVGFRLDLNDIKSGLNRLGEDIKDTAYESMLQTLSIRSMSKAEYSIQNIGHYGLGFEYYSHFTSPIRRYSDLVAHRLITKYMENGKSENPVKYSNICEQCNNMEQNAKRAERDSIKFKQVEYMLDKVGQVFNGTISGVTDWGVYIELTESRCEGLVRKDDIDGQIEKDKYRIVMSDGEKS